MSFKQALVMLLCFSACLRGAAAKVVFVAELTTPGSTVPWTLLKNSPWTAVGRGQLSDSGRRSQYVAGMDLKTRYPALLNTTLPAGSVDYVFFQEPNTINSGHLRLSALFDGQQKNEDLPFPNEDPRLAPGTVQLTLNFSEVDFNRSLPHKFLPPLIAGSNNYQDFSLDKSRCPVARSYEMRGQQKFAALLTTMAVTPVVKQIIETAADLYDQEANPKFANKDDLETCRTLAEFAIAEFYNDPKAQFDRADRADFVGLRNCFSAYQASMFSDPVYLQAYVTPYLLSVRAEIAAAASDPAKYKKRYHLFSDNQETVLAVLLQAGITSADCILLDLKNRQDTFGCPKNFEQASMLTFELHQREEGDKGFFVQFKLNGEPKNFCGLPETDKDPFSCPLQAFHERVQLLTIPDLKTWCRQAPFSPDHSNSHDLWRIFSFAMVILIVLLAMTGWMVYQYQTASEQTADVTESFNKTMGATIEEKVPA